MATTTEVLGLVKPTYTDTANIEVINANMDIIDGAVKNLQDADTEQRQLIEQLQGSTAPDTAITGISRSETTFTATRANGSTFQFTQQDNDTWIPNSRAAAGYVSAGANQANKVWKTDANGNPGWRNDADTNTTYSAGTGIGLSGTTFSNNGVLSVRCSNWSGARSGNVTIGASDVGASASGHTHNYAPNATVLYENATGNDTQIHFVSGTNASKYRYFRIYYGYNFGSMGGFSRYSIVVDTNLSSNFGTMCVGWPLVDTAQVGWKHWLIEKNMNRISIMATTRNQGYINVGLDAMGTATAGTYFGMRIYKVEAW